MIGSALIIVAGMTPTRAGCEADESAGTYDGADHHPVIPSLQWFCADGICPMVINHTLTTRDGDHMTKE